MFIKFVHSIHLFHSKHIKFINPNLKHNIMALTRDQEQYLKQRGFEAIAGRPEQDQEFPYVLLGPISRTMARGEIEYHISQGAMDTTAYQCHPSLQDQDYLVARVAGIVANGIVEEGKHFTTKPGTPFRVFVEDEHWQPIADRLATAFLP
jgi:hypothetical protein